MNTRWKTDKLKRNASEKNTKFRVKLDIIKQIKTATKRNLTIENEHCCSSFGLKISHLSSFSRPGISKVAPTVFAMSLL